MATGGLPETDESSGRGTVGACLVYCTAATIRHIRVGRLSLDRFDRQSLGFEASAVDALQSYEQFHCLLQCI